MNKKKIIVATVTLIVAIFAGIFGFNYTQEDIDKISDGVETITNIVEEIQIANLTQEDEQSTEVQETNLENDTFKEKSEVAYNGSDKTPNVSVGDYKGLTYYSQADSRWASHKYGNNNMLNSGCGPTAAAMVVSSIKGEITPPEMGDLFVKYGYRSANAGTYWSAMKWTADVFDIEYKETSNFNTMISKLQDNNYVIAICREGLFTYGGHFIVIVGQDGDNLKIYDPYLYSGKFTTASRKVANAKVNGNTVTISKANFKKYANAVNYFCYKNDRTDNKVNNIVIKEENKSNTVKSTNYTVKVTAKVGLKIRSGASTKYKRVGAYAYNTKVKITSVSGSWGKTSKGWICLDYTKKVTTTSSSNKYKIATGSKNLNIRSGNSTKYRVVGSYKKGTTVTVTSIKNGWGKTSKGWICLKYCKKV